MSRRSTPKPPPPAAPAAFSFDERPSITPLTFEERQHLQRLLSDPVFVKAWGNARAAKPSSFIANTESLNGAFGPQIAANRLHQIQGWDMCAAALLRQIEDPQLPRRQIQETYPDAGLPGRPVR